MKLHTPSVFLPSLYLLAIVVAVATPGCGHRPDLPPMARVSGTVTIDGKPLPRGTVQFVPDPSQSDRQPSGVGEIDENGRYEIRTAGERGAVVGTHMVGVEAREEVDLNETSWAPSLIPERYNDPCTSGLVFEVEADEENVIDLELSSRP
jgi:hypothetical protein